MKTISATAAAAIIALSGAIGVSATSPVAETDSITSAVRLQGLETRRANLEKEIKTQEVKRNARIAGVSPETLETMNKRQDSICMALRSELVDVILEIKENTRVRLPEKKK